ncbi:MAG TPA: DUF6389 family protein [Nocardioides sp.]|uniref:DUF6389 family protein n=1 Tax=Nocardioides sp. TaxID=35761 RepID=UPI002CB10976|nr:DUF6389 family protein [Nocardioides sp.]HTW13922.1 DUF6389 family protein [Nocardioides sp.]
MNAARYRSDLTRILDAASAEVAERLRRFADVATDGIVIDVFVDQDGEGPFDVWARFDGSDGFVLDRRFDDERRLFGVEWGEEGWDPDVPARPREWSRDDLETELVELVAIWLSGVIPSHPMLCWELGDPGGTRGPRRLAPGAA